MNLIEFINQYPSEESCKRKWHEICEKYGVVCPIADARSIIGNKTKNALRVSIASIDKALEQALLCTVASCHFAIGS